MSGEVLHHPCRGHRYARKGPLAAAFHYIDPCSKRRLVYGNPVLYDLIRCFHGDLPHVTTINWQTNGAMMSWDDFYNRHLQGRHQGRVRPEDGRPTINENTFQVMVKMEDSDTGNFTVRNDPWRCLVRLR